MSILCARDALLLPITCAQDLVRPLVVVCAAEAVLVPMQTTMELVAKLKDQQEETARQVANGGGGVALPAEPSTPVVPGTPNGRFGRRCVGTCRGR